MLPHYRCITATLGARAQLTDAEWALIEPYLPVGERGPYPERLRQQFEGVIWRVSPRRPPVASSAR